MSSYIPFLVTIETDPTRFHGEHPRIPATPGHAACEQILAHLLTDLEGLFPGIGEFDFALPGAVYDQTQILQPGLPIFKALRKSLSEYRQHHGEARRLAITLKELPGGERSLLPDPSIIPGLMQNLPVVLFGKAAALDTIGEAMEHRFLEEGQLSAHAARALESHFGIAVNHARFMTLTDLRAMLKLQLEHFQFQGLWELLDAAVESQDASVSVTARAGQQFEYRDGTVHCRFEPFDFWTLQGAGRAIAEEDLAEAYTEWTREYRQYVTTLEAHRVPLVHRPADPACAVIEGDYLVETSGRRPRAGEDQVTQHAWSDVGVVAVTLLSDGRQYNYYPLSAHGLDDLHGAIRALGSGPMEISYPGRLVLDRSSRRLMPETSAFRNA